MCYYQIFNAFWEFAHFSDFCHGYNRYSWVPSTVQYRHAFAHSKIQPWHHGKRRPHKERGLSPKNRLWCNMTPASCAQVCGQTFSVHLITEWLPRSSYRLYFKMGDEPSGTVQVVRIGKDQQPTEVTIFYSPGDGSFLVTIIGTLYDLFLVRNWLSLWFFLRLRSTQRIPFRG